MEEDREGSARRQVDVIVASLRARLGNAIDVSVIAAEVEAAFAAFAGSRVATFVPILVESRVNDRLQQRASRDADSG